MDKLKNISLSVAVIAGISALVFGVTQAVWTDTATNTDNTFASGYVEIELEGVGGEHTTTNFFNTSGMMPGDSESAQILIGNRSSGPVGFDVDLVNPTYGGEGLGLDRVLEVQIIQVDDPNNVDAGMWNDHFTGGGSFTLWTEGNTGAEIVSFETTTLRDWLNNPGSIGSDAYDLPAGYAGVYDVVVRLAPDAGNEYQNKSFTVDLLVTATSVISD